MAFRLDDLVIAGCLYHSGSYCVHGRLLLRGLEAPVEVQLTGAPADDLRGRSFEFEVPANDRPATAEDCARLGRFCPQQVGPVGDMTAALQRKTLDRTPEAFGQTAAIRWCRCLYLEWFSQNGRVVIELLDPKLKFLESTALPEQSGELAPEAGDAEEEFDSLDPNQFPGEEDDDWEMFSTGEEPAAAGEMYGLIPQDLQLELDEAARRIDREIAGDPVRGDAPRWNDDSTDHTNETLIREFLEELPLPAPDALLTPREAKLALDTALGRLALFGVAFSICEHCSIPEAYRILIEEVCELRTAYLRPEDFISGIHHFSTSDYCDECVRESLD